jgi:hypothetical protein
MHFNIPQIKRKDFSPEKSQKLILNFNFQKLSETPPPKKKGRKN